MNCIHWNNGYDFYEWICVFTTGKIHTMHFIQRISLIYETISPNNNGAWFTSFLFVRVTVNVPLVRVKPINRTRTRTRTRVNGNCWTFDGQNAFPVAQPTATNHWRDIVFALCRTWWSLTTWPLWPCDLFDHATLKITMKYRYHGEFWHKSEPSDFLLSNKAEQHKLNNSNMLTSWPAFTR